MRVSVVINTYNRMNCLPTALTSLSFLRYPQLEVIVVDGPSDDGTSDYLNAVWGGKIKIAHCSERNLSKSRNIGIQRASGDIICFTDDDGIPEPDWIDRLLEAYEDPRVAAVGGWVRNHTGVQYQTKFIVSTRDSSSEVLVEDDTQVPAARPHAHSFPGLIGVNSSFRRSALLEVGGFDEEYAYFLDETDVLVRLVDAGYLIKIVPEAEVHHKYAPSHIRAENGIAKSWLQIMTSTSYYLVQNAAPDVPLSNTLERIGHHQQQLRNHTNWFRSEQLIDDARHSELIAEIEQGARRGISDAFEFPNRRLIADHALEPWHPLARRNSDQRIRIALVTGLYPPRPCGGVAVFMRTLAETLAKQGHEVTVITQAAEGRPHTVDFEDGVWVHRLPSDDSIEPILPETMPDMPSSIAAFAGRVLGELDRVNLHRQFQYVVGSIWDLEIAAVIASGRYLTGMYLVTSYKLMEESKPEWKRNAHFYQHHVQKMIAAETWAVRNCTKVLGSTQSIVEDVSNAYGVKIPASRCEIIPFGIPVDEGPAPNQASDGVSLLFVGRLEERKGIDTIIAALPRIMSSSPDLSLDIVGDDQLADADGSTYRKRCEKLYKSADWLSRVRFHGHVDEEELTRFYRDCSIFMAPSKYESFGLIYLEAMRFAKPCIGCKVGGIPEVVKDRSTGILIEPGSADQLSDAVLQLSADPKLRRKMGQAGLALFKERFTADRFAEAIVTHVEGVISAPELRKL